MKDFVLFLAFLNTSSMIIICFKNTILLFQFKHNLLKAFGFAQGERI